MSRRYYSNRPRSVSWDLPHRLSTIARERAALAPPITETEARHLEAFSSRVCWLRVRAGWTAEQFAARCGLTASGYGNLERAIRRPRRETVAKVARALAWDDASADRFQRELFDLLGPAVTAERGQPTEALPA